ncbi:penicillin-binding transpeptidase domain-containing protein [Actinomadura livida]|uniref:Penicillin-binding transpeptidase domain-containing protein n=1 Tax=Actinomadura livida TaxID=79909 RepID=A0A7W7N0G4_9ACTN|nr:MULTISPECIES: penicillin-binding transpeptidase domain-containing protein [Actinomadura]MBB4776902.1 peptidoglycan glycosyltransferase [Actinomadura catellatispora]GGT95621.1 cell division protein FtsI [Actinomadura livida]
MRPGIDRALTRTWVVTLVLAAALMANITYVQGFQAEELRDSALNSRRLDDRFKVDRGPIVADGVRLAWSEKAGDERYRRRYREGPVFAPVTGYFSVFSQTGLEEAANHFLDGTDDRLATANLIDKILGKKVPGGTVEATVDVRAQRVAYEALSAAGARRAAAVVLDADTGAIRVLASTPTYDPNEVSTLDGERATAAFERLNAQPLKPLLDKAAKELFPPGSTFKAVVAAAALEAGATSDTGVTAGRSYRPPGAGQAINNDAADIGGSCDRARIPLIEAFAQSCNTTFAYMGAEEPGNGAVHEKAAAFGFGDRIEYADGVLSAASSFPETGEAALSALGSIGQGSTVATPLQMAMVAAAAVNDGVVMRPRLIEKFRAPGGRTVDDVSPRRMSRALSSEQAAQMRDMMEAVVQRGTGRSLRGTSILGGKTGTADVEGASYNERWFIGFGPRENPEYAVAVLTEAPGYGIESGPIAARIVAALSRE